MFKRWMRWLFKAELDDFIYSVWSKDLYRRIDAIESLYRTTKEIVMEKKLRECGFEIVNTFPRPKYTLDGEIVLEELPKHPSGFWEIRGKYK